MSLSLKPLALSLIGSSLLLGCATRERVIIATTPATKTAAQKQAVEQTRFELEQNEVFQKMIRRINHPEER